MLPCVKGEMGCASEGYNLQTYICAINWDISYYLTLCYTLPLRPCFYWG